MSVALTLIPIDGFEFRDQAVLRPQNRLELSWVDDGLVRQFEKLKPLPLPQGKKVILRERGDDLLEEDPYGDRITYLTPQAFKKLRIPQELPPWDKTMLRTL